MVLDIDMLRKFYASYSKEVAKARTVLGRPMTYAEKVLYAHLYDKESIRPFKRLEDYVDFRPNRVAMQDATAQMALLQFMNAGKDKVAVPQRYIAIISYVRTSEWRRICRRQGKPTRRYTTSCAA